MGILAWGIVVISILVQCLVTWFLAHCLTAILALFGINISIYLSGLIVCFIALVILAFI